MSMNENARLARYTKLLQGVSGTTAGIAIQSMRFHNSIGKWIVGCEDGIFGFMDTPFGTFTEAPGSPLAGATLNTTCIQMQEDYRNGGIIYVDRTEMWYCDSDGNLLAHGTTTQSSAAHFTRPGDNNAYILTGSGVLWFSDDAWATHTVSTNILGASPGIMPISQDDDFLCSCTTTKLAQYYLQDDPTDINNWDIQTVSFFGLQPTVGAAVSPTRSVWGNVNCDIYIWDFGSAPYAVPAADNWLTNAPNTGVAPTVEAIVYSPELEGFILLCSSSAALGFIPDGELVVEGISKWSKQDIIGSFKNSGTVSGGYDPNTLKVAWAVGDYLLGNVF